MRRHTRSLAVATAVIALLALIVSGAAVGQQVGWSDLTDEILSDYGITAAEVGQISEGYNDGTWRPYAEMTRAQFVKMAVEAFDLPMVTPATPTFVDVPADNQFYVYVESAYDAGLIEGTGADSSGRYFSPYSPVTRQQGAAIIVRYQADQDGINLETAYGPAEITALLAPFNDDAAVSEALRSEVAAAVDWGILKGTTDNYLRPANPLLRIQGAAMLIRSGGGGTPTTTTTVGPTTTTTAGPTTTTTAGPTTTTTAGPTTTTTEAPTGPQAGNGMLQSLTDTNPLVPGSVPRTVLTSGNIVGLNEFDPAILLPAGEFYGFGVQVLDEFGDPMVGIDFAGSNPKVEYEGEREGNPLAGLLLPADSFVTDAQGYIVWAPVLQNTIDGDFRVFWAWFDTNDDDVRDAGELQWPVFRVDLVAPAG